MKIQYASDLHLEFADNWRYLRDNPLQVSGDILILAGDIGYLGDQNYQNHPFWDWASENYRQVLVVPGNHEFYKYYDLSKMEDGTEGEIRKNVHNYYNKVVRIEDVDFILHQAAWGRVPRSCGLLSARKMPLMFSMALLIFIGLCMEIELLPILILIWSMIIVSISLRSQ